MPFQERNLPGLPLHMLFTLDSFAIKSETSASQGFSAIEYREGNGKVVLEPCSKIKTELLTYNLCYYINKLLGRAINVSRIKELMFG